MGIYLSVEDCIAEIRLWDLERKLGEMSASREVDAERYLGQRVLGRRVKMPCTGDTAEAECGKSVVGRYPRIRDCGKARGIGFGKKLFEILKR